MLRIAAEAVFTMDSGGLMDARHAVTRSGWAVFVLVLVGWGLLVGCSQERPVAPVSLVVPVQWGVNTVDAVAVFGSVRQYLEGAGLKSDRSRTDAAKGVFVSQPARCAPNADERHVALCVFTANVAPSQANPQQVAVEVRVRAGQPVKFDPALARDQIRIEPTLDGVVTALRARFTFAEVTRTDSLSF